MTERQKMICKKHIKRDKDGKVHCFECPLRVSQDKWDFRCRANSTYNPHTKEWEIVEEGAIG